MATMMMIIRGRYILRSSSTKTVASKTNHLITNNNRRLVSTATPALLQSSSFKYDAPWIHYNNNEQRPTIKNFINGTFEEVTDATSQIPLYDPSTNQVLSYVPESTSSATTNEEDALQRAVKAAKDAYPKWSNTPVQSRQRLLLDYAHFLHGKEVREEIA